MGLDLQGLQQYDWLDTYRKQHCRDSIVNLTTRHLIATAVLALSTTNASTASNTFGMLFSGNGAPASPSVATLTATHAVTSTAQGFWSAFGGDSSSQPPAYMVALAGLAAVAFVMRRRQPD